MEELSKELGDELPLDEGKEDNEAEELSGEGTAKKKKNKKRKKRNKKKDKDPSEMASFTSPKSIVSPLQDKLDEKL